MPEDRPVPASLDATRDQVVDTLSRSFAADRLKLDELERRMELAHRATSLAELQSLVSDLPASASTAPSPAPATPVDAAERRTIVAIMSGASRRGEWTVPRALRVIAVMGGVELDLREAYLESGVTEIEIFALMGGALIRVPPDVRVEVDGSAFMGGFEESRRGRPAERLPPDAPVLRVTGFALMGGVEVKASARS
jgi:hypothetical protein